MGRRARDRQCQKAWTRHGRRPWLAPPAGRTIVLEVAMYRRMLVAIDRRGLADHALPTVAALARQCLGEVLVVSQPDAMETPAAASCRVKEVVRRLEAGGVAAHGEVLPTHTQTPARLIVKAACDFGADLVALGSRGRGDLAGLFLGSVGHQVAAQVRCPVLLVHGKGDTPDELQPLRLRRLLVAVRTTAESEEALAVARTLAAEHGADVLVVHALEMAFDSEDAWYTEADAEAEAVVQRAAERLDGCGRVETRVVHGGPVVAADIAATAERWDADLIVLASRRPTDLGGLLLGSVAHGVVRRTQRPALLAERAAVAAEVAGPS
jgi:nucleotide-binding universal stress UspA family protein